MTEPPPRAASRARFRAEKPAIEFKKKLIIVFACYLVCFVRVSYDLGGVTSEEHYHDSTEESGHGVVPPVSRGKCVVDFTVPVSDYESG